MARTKDSLKAKMKAELEGKGFVFDSVGRTPTPWLDNFIDALAKAYIDDYHENGKAVGTDSNGDSHSLSLE